MELAALRTASLLGASSGLRTFSGPAALALHGRLGRGRARVAVIAAGAGELAFDKLPGVPARTHVSGLGARLTTGTLSGHRVAGPGGRRRSAAPPRWAARSPACTRGPCWPSACRYRMPWSAPPRTRSCSASSRSPRVRGHRRPPTRPERLAARGGRVAAGVAATAVGTAAMTAAQAAAGSDSDAPGRVGRRLVEAAFGRRVRRRERGPLNHAMHWLYGTSWGVALGALTAGRGRAAAGRADRPRARARRVGREPG